MKRGILFRTVRSVAVLAAACGISVFLFAIRAEPERQKISEAIPVVEVIEAVPENRIMVVETFGTVYPRKKITLSAEVSGRVQWVNSRFVEGGWVDRNAALVRIDPEDYRLEKEGAQNQVAQARADINRLEQEILNFRTTRVLAAESALLAKEELQRQKALNREAFSSLSLLDKTRRQELEARMSLTSIDNNLALTDAVMKQKRAVLSLAMTTLAKAERVLEKTEIRSPVKGLVLSKTIEEGEFVTLGKILGIIYEDNALDVDVRIPLEKMEWIAPVLSEGRMPEVVVALTTDGDHFRWKGQVARIKAEIDETTRTLPMTVEILSEAGNAFSNELLKPGAFVQCTIQGEHKKGIVAIPRHLLNPGNTVYTVADDKLVRKSVHVIRKFREEVYIDQGLEKGDRVISTPIPNAVEGMTVIVRDGGGRETS